MLLLLLWWRKKRTSGIIQPGTPPPVLPGRAPAGFLPPRKEMSTMTGQPPPTGGAVAPEPVPFPEITEQGIIEHPGGQPDPASLVQAPYTDYTASRIQPGVQPPPNGAPPPPLPPPVRHDVPVMDAWQGDNGTQYQLPPDEAINDAMEEPMYDYTGEYDPSQAMDPVSDVSPQYTTRPDGLGRFWGGRR